MRLRYVLIGDGPSDDVLHQPILWTLRRLRPNLVVGESPFVPRATDRPAT